MKSWRNLGGCGEKCLPVGMARAESQRSHRLSVWGMHGAGSALLLSHRWEERALQPCFWRVLFSPVWIVCIASFQLFLENSEYKCLLWEECLGKKSSHHFARSLSGSVLERTPTFLQANGLLCSFQTMTHQLVHPYWLHFLWEILHHPQSKHCQLIRARRGTAHLHQTRTRALRGLTQPQQMVTGKCF